jgi:hypothetical protein
VEKMRPAMHLPKLAAWKMARKWRECNPSFVKNVDSITSNRKAAKLTDVFNSSERIRIDRVILSLGNVTRITSGDRCSLVTRLA